MEKSQQKREKVADIVQRARVQKGWTQTELAEKVGVNFSTISRFELGKFNLNADVVYQIFEALDIEFKLNGEII